MLINDIAHWLQALILPPGLIILLLLISIILLNYRRQWANALLFLSTFLLWSVCTPFITNEIINPLQLKFKTLQVTEINPEQSAIVVLGAGVENAMEFERKSSLSSTSAKRVDYAAYLSRKSHLPIIVSGGNKSAFGHTEAEVMRDVLLADYGIKVLGLENQSHNTKEESELLLMLLKPLNIKHVYLVTHAYHMPRSLYIFKKTFNNSGISITPAPTGVINVMSQDHVANYLPSMNALLASVNAVHEYLGWLWYIIYSNMN